jgi:hypothetical protein
MKIQKTIGAAVMSLALVVGLSGGAVGAVTGSITTTGPDSSNRIRSDSFRRVNVDNDNDLRFRNDNRQRADTGDARVTDNTRGGDAETGSAANENETSVSATVDNGGSAGAWSGVLNGGGGDHDITIEETGPDSNNRVDVRDTTRVDVRNDNNLNITNNNDQRATSGDARVSHNTSGGDARTGDATNTNSTTVELNVSN